MSAPPPVIAAEGVSRWFGPVTALDGVDLLVQPGSVHGLVGPNGAGKTTLLAILLGLVHPDEGSVRIFGRSKAEAGRAWLDGVGSSLEVPQLYPHLSARQNLAALAALDDCPGSPSVDAVLGEVGLADAAGQKVRGFSLGMRQRLGLAAALLRSPRLLVLDEPTNGLDVLALGDLRDRIAEHARQGGAVLLSSHDMAQIQSLCDTVTVLARGKVVFSGSFEELRSAAPAPVWHLATTDDERAVALATAAPDVEVTRPAALRVEAEPPHLQDLVLTLGRAGIAVTELWEDASPLESLFAVLTRTEQAPAAPAPAAASAVRTP